MNHPNDPKFDPGLRKRALFFLWLFVLIFVPPSQLKNIIVLGGFLIILARILVRYRSSFNLWMTKQENLKLRDLDLNILAVERGCEYLKESLILSKKLFSLIDAIQDVDEAFKNFLVGKEVNGQYFLFEYSPETFSIQAQPSFHIMKENSAGVGVEYSFTRVPEFLLIHGSIEEYIRLRQDEYSNPKFHRYMHKLPEKDFPDWLSATDFLCLCAKGDQPAVVQLLEDNPSLVHITNEQSIRLISFKQDLACAFFKKILNADGSNIGTQIEYAFQLLNIAGNEPEPSEKGPDSI